MIVSVNPEPHREAFDALLASTVGTLNVHATNPAQQLETLTGRNLEPYVKDLMAELAVGTPFENSIELIGGQRFPDIVANRFYGIEVKTTTQNHWKTTGNSVLETTRVEHVERIFMLFAKLASPIEFRARPYEEVLSEVVVTHSPRYLIDMNLGPGQTIFDKIDMPYDELRLSGNPIRPIVDYYKSKLRPGEELWWMDKSEEIGGTKLVFWSNVVKRRKAYLKKKGMILFPEMFGSSSTKYSRIAFWLLTKESIVCPNVRDPFSAGGKEDFVIGHQVYPMVPKIFINLFVSISTIVEIIYLSSPEELSEYWEIQTTEATKLHDWMDLVDRNAKTVSEAGHLDIKQMLTHLISK